MSDLPDTTTTHEYESSTWDIDQGVELAPGCLAWDVLDVGNRFEMWVAWCTGRLTPVCVKLPRRDCMNQRTFDALRREHDIAASFDHPAIPRVFGADLECERPYLVHEFIEGMPLAMILDEQGPFDGSDVVLLGLQLGAALRHIHQRGFVHLDVKPTNVALRGDRALLFDFDIALPVGGLRSMTKPRGTHRYMAPEQIRCEPAHPSMDLFALGATLYEVATDEVAFAAESVEGRTITAGRPREYRQNGSPIPPVRDLAADLDPAIASVIDRLISIDVDQRPSSADEVIRLLDNAVPADGERMWPRWVTEAVLDEPPTGALRSAS